MIVHRRVDDRADVGNFRHAAWRGKSGTGAGRGVSGKEDAAVGPGRRRDRGGRSVSGADALRRSVEDQRVSGAGTNRLRDVVLNHPGGRRRCPRRSFTSVKDARQQRDHVGNASDFDLISKTGDRKPASGSADNDGNHVASGDRGGLRDGRVRGIGAITNRDRHKELPRD